MKIIISMIVLSASAFVAKSGESAKSGVMDCRSVAKSFGQSIKGKPIDLVLDQLAKEIESSPDCSCEIIKSAIAVHKPTTQQVAIMVDTAINVAPDHIEEIINCSIAAAPDAKSGILAEAGEYGYTPNPLDFPGIPGEHPGGQWQIIPHVPIIVIAPQVTQVDP